jgi:hypothetical protein
MGTWSATAMVAEFVEGRVLGSSCVVTGGGRGICRVLVK